MEPISIMASIIPILEATSASSQALLRVVQFPKVFEEVKNYLPLVQRISKDAETLLNGNITTDERASIKAILDASNKKAIELKRIFAALEDKYKEEKCMEADQDKDKKPWTTVRGWYRDVLRTLKGHRVEVLMKDILRDLKKLEKLGMFRGASQEDIAKIKEALEKLSEEEPSLEDHEMFGPLDSVNATQTVASGAAGQLNQPLGGANTFDSSLYRQGDGGTMNIVNDAEDMLLTHLRVTDPSHDKQRIENVKGGLLRDCYNWILEHPDFIQWRQDSHSRLLWIMGDPGKGKTMLLCGIIDELRREEASQAHQLAYFFCQATDDRLNSATAVLRGLLYTLLIQHPDLVNRYVRQEYRQAGRDLFEDANAWTAMSTIFQKMLPDPALKGEIFIIDALDECVTDTSRLLGLIAQISSTSETKSIVSSRNLLTIKEALDVHMQKLTICLELNAQSISDAVRTYIRHKVDGLTQLRQDKQTYDAVLEHLENHSGNTFLWVALVYERLKDENGWDMIDVVKEVPPDLENLYAHMIERNPELSRPGRNPHRAILSTIVTAFRPLHLVELARLSDLAPNVYRFEGFAERIVHQCGCFLTIREDVVYTIHQSARDFLVTSKVIFPSGIKKGHYTTFSKSLEVLRDTLQYNIWQVPEPVSYFYMNYSLHKPNPNPLKPIKYACVHWVGHLRESNPLESPACNDIKDNAIVHGFLKTQFLNWFEALSLLGSVLEGMLAVQELAILMKNSGSGATELKELVQDARRFVLRYNATIRMNPFQVYGPALLQSPVNSVVRRLYDDKTGFVSPWIETEWNACVQTLRSLGHDVHSIAFAPDGRWLASGSNELFTYAHRRIQVWDAKTGAATLKIKAGSHINMIAFTADGRLASGLDDHNIKIWDVKTGACLKTLEGHGNAVLSVAFAPDGRLASGSRDRSIKIWDTNTADCVKTLNGHNDSVNSIAFSPVGQLASGSRDGIIKIWNTNTGHCMQTLNGHNYSVNSIAFSPDGQLASGSEDSTIKIWNIKIGVCLRTLQGHNHSILSVAFAPDGRLASGSRDGTIKIWNTNTGHCMQMLENYKGGIVSVAFAPDGELASGSSGGTVKIWETVTDAYVDICGHDEPVISVNLSPNGQQIEIGHESARPDLSDLDVWGCQYYKA